MLVWVDFRRVQEYRTHPAHSLGPQSLTHTNQHMPSSPQICDTHRVNPEMIQNISHGWHFVYSNDGNTDSSFTDCQNEK